MTTQPGLAVEGFTVADPAEAWLAAGFAVEDGTCRIGGVAIGLVGREHGTGIVGWSLGAPETSLTELDGVPVLPVAAGRECEHPNGVTAIDHVVLLSPDLARTVAAFAAVGADPRRERDGELGGQSIRQVFFRCGEIVVEVVGSPDTVGDGPSSLWGLTFVVDDIDAAAAFFGERTSPVKDAVQPGRRITTLRHRDLGLSVRTALISPRPPRQR